MKRNPALVDLNLFMSKHNNSKKILNKEKFEKDINSEQLAIQKGIQSLR